MSEYLNQEPFTNMSLLFGVILIGVGLIFRFRPPKQINSFYGYRSGRSMKDQAHWDFAHKYSAKVSFYLGLACLAAAPLGWIMEFSELIETFIGVGWLIIVSITLIWRTEKAIKEKFDE